MDYKIEVVSATPALEKKDLYRRKVYLGVSMSNPVFRSAKLSALLNWMGRRFPQTTIVLGDQLNRFNLRIQLGLEMAEAECRALKDGDEMESAVRSAIPTEPASRFDLLRWPALASSPCVGASRKALVSALETHPGFRHSVGSASKEYVHRLVSRGVRIAVSRREAEELSREYVIEELAVFDHLIAQGIATQIYPGTQLSTLKNIALGRIAMPKSLRLGEGVYVDVRAKKRATNHSAWGS